MRQLDRLARPFVKDIARRFVSDDRPVEDRARVAFEALTAERSRAALEAGFSTRALDALDRIIRTDEPEHLDLAEFPEHRKLRLVRTLHRFNLAIGAYRRFLRIVEPHLQQARRQLGRTPRLLELASGAGEFSLELARLAQDRGLDLEVTGSDIVGAQVDRANAEARRRRLSARFIHLNAFAMDELEPGSHDVVFIAQSLHHFTPGQLARLIEQASRIATNAFIGVDGRRDPSKLLLVPGPTWWFPWTSHFHDAFTTARKFYYESELELLARIAAPDARVRTRSDGLVYSVLTVEPSDPLRG